MGADTDTPDLKLTQMSTQNPRVFNNIGTMMNMECTGEIAKAVRNKYV